MRLIEIVVVLIVMPFVIYFSAKLGTYGALSASKQFKRNQESDNGEESKRS